MRWLGQSRVRASLVWVKLCQGASCDLPTRGRSRPHRVGVCGRGTLGHVKRGAQRLFVKLTLCTLAGAVVTWAVAWGCALLARPQSGSMLGTWLEPTPKFQEPADPWPRGCPAEWGSPGASTVANNALWTARAWRRGNQKLPREWLAFQCDLGWPCRSMRGEDIRDGKRIVRDTWFSFGDRSVPVRALPLGFAFNTLLAAGVVLGVVEGFAFARRRVQRAKGRCEACGYDCGGIAKDAACPECDAGPA
jgi:hypothetical protein